MASRSSWSGSKPISFRPWGVLRSKWIGNSHWPISAKPPLPLVRTDWEDALRAVPDSYREAALSLGASRWEIVYRVLFPAARGRRLRFARRLRLGRWHQFRLPGTRRLARGRTGAPARAGAPA